MYCLRLLFSALSSLLVAVHVQAHNPGLSTADLKMVDNRLTAHLTFSWRDIDTIVPMDLDHDGSVASKEFVAVRPRLQTLASRAIKISIDDQLLSPQVNAVELDQSDALHFLLSFPLKTGTRLSVSAPVIGELARGHRQHVTFRDENGQTRTGIMSALQEDLSLDLQQTDGKMQR